MGEPRKSLGEGARLLAVAGAYVPALHCHTAPPPTAGAGGQDGHAVAVEPAEPAEPLPAPPQDGPGASSGGEAAPAAAPSDGGVAPAAAALPDRPGAGSTAERRFLEQIALAAPSAPGGTDALRGVVEETYGRFSAALGTAYEGRMGTAVDVTALAPTLRFSATYVPTSEPWASRYEEVTVLYEIPLAADGPPASHPARVSAVGRLRGGGSEAVLPAVTHEVRRREEGRRDCAYPRWNPRGMRYGLFATITPDPEG